MFNQYGVIFDMDGVLADTSQIHFESWLKVAKEVGVTFTREFFEGAMGQQSPSIMRKLIGSKMDQKSVEKWAALKEVYYREMVKNKLEPIPGVKRIISNLSSEGFKLAVGSSGPKENVELTLSSLNIKDYFDTVITAAEVKNGKPEPDVFLIAAKNLEINPKNCLVIEDAPLGIEAAKSAGMLSIAITTTHSKEELFDAQMIIQDFSEINVKDILKLFNFNV